MFVRLNRNGQPLAKALHPNQVALIVKDRAGYRQREINTILGLVREAARIQCERPSSCEDLREIVVTRAPPARCRGP